MWKLWIIILSCPLMLGCIPFHTCTQFKPTCSIEAYAIIEFNNYTEENRYTYVQQMYDGEPLGEPIVEIVEAKTAHRYHVPSGYYELGQKNRDGTYQAWQTREKGKGNPWVPLLVCSTTVVNMADKIVPPKELVIRPRKQPE